MRFAQSDVFRTQLFRSLTMLECVFQRFTQILLWAISWCVLACGSNSCGLLLFWGTVSQAAGLEEASTSPCLVHVARGRAASLCKIGLPGVRADVILVIPVVFRRMGNSSKRVAFAGGRVGDLAPRSRNHWRFA